MGIIFHLNHVIPMFKLPEMTAPNYQEVHSNTALFCDTTLHSQQLKQCKVITASRNDVSGKRKMTREKRLTKTDTAV